MEVKLNLVSEEVIALPISQENKEIILNLNNQENVNEIEKKEGEKIIREEIKKNNYFLKDITNEDYFDLNIKNDNSNKKEKDENKEYNLCIEIKCKDKLKEEIENKINSCMEKEKILINKQNEFKDLCDSLVIDEKLLEKKLISLIGKNDDDYEKTINKISTEILNYDNFKKEVIKIQDRLIKYRDSLIIGNCFKLYVKKIYEPILYLNKKNIIFLNNEKLFKMANNIYQKIIKIIINEIYDSILKKISNNEIYKANKEDYDQKLNFYKQICYLFPILKFFENNQDNEIFEIENDINLTFSENIYDQIIRINTQIPKRNGLNISLDYFKMHTNMEQTYGMALRRIILIYQKYKVLFPFFKKGSFLYE